MFDTTIDGKFVHSPERFNVTTGRTYGVRTGWPVVLLRTCSYISLPVSLVG